MRGAGNCPTELLLGFLKNPKFDIVPLLDAISKHVLQMQRAVDWGYHVPYRLTGIRDVHPRTAIEWMGSPRKDDLVAFYRKLETDYE